MTDEPLLDVLALPAWRIFRNGDIREFAGKHIGIACQMRWSEIAGYLSRSVQGDPLKYPDSEIAKRQEGGWTGGLYRDNHRTVDALVHTEVMTVDIDGHGDIERAAAAFAKYRKIIHSTYKSTADAPRCRVVLHLSKPCTDARAYAAAHKAIREHMIAWGYVGKDRARGIKGDVDDGASDCARLNYAPMHHSTRTPRFLSTAGELVDIERIAATPKATRTVPLRPRGEGNVDAYRRGALARASAAMAAALEGERHEVLFREAASLSRRELGLSAPDIYNALLPMFVRAAGESREREGERTIADAIAKGRCG